MSLKDLIFQKGGIGVSMSREETIERLNPLIKQHMKLNHAYNDVIARLSDRAIADELAAQQRTARMDVGKLMETVLSAGGLAYNGVDLEPDSVHLGDDDDTMLFALRDLEETFLKTVSDASTPDHQIRSKAILGVVENNSRQRFSVLKDHTNRRRRKTSSLGN
jgi:hypothetical protein